MTRIIDLFGHDTTAAKQPNWSGIITRQQCPFVQKKCYKVRKSQSDVAIGTCTLVYGEGPVMTCPLRLLERGQVFTDCLHLLTGHEPGNELHIVPEISVPGGHVDYILASIRSKKVRDFVGIELQTLDTTGTVWPERQRFLASKGISGVSRSDLENKKSYGINWRMTAKTTLVQLNHKVQTFEAVNKHLVLVMQDRLMAYMAKEFRFGHLSEPRVSDPMHFHAYAMIKNQRGHKLEMARRLSTDANGIATCLGLQNEAKLELDVIVERIEKKITEKTRFDFDQPPLPINVDPEA